ncbi:hypothetical protein HPP92_026169 [Vanilla planifolia]|uniref:Uncharacterized protein n=1 Tax=Vanilla planifolia TaxID=51239 RepID=A0A835PFB0_VANPL|nr:hypothetical protein HPP92_026169 [Vanilla planifolia]
MEDEPRRRVFTEAPTFSRSFVVSPGLKVVDIPGEDDFEFILTSFKLDPVFSTDDEMFSDGQVRHMYPVFDRGLIAKEEKSGLELDLQELHFASCDLRSRSAPSSSSMSTEEDGTVVREVCCLWSTRSPPQSPDRQWKRASTGSSGTRGGEFRIYYSGEAERWR